MGRAVALSMVVRLGGYKPDAQGGSGDVNAPKLDRAGSAIPLRK
jgi:hypothetical protein